MYAIGARIRPICSEFRGGEWKVQLDFGRVMQFEVDGSDFEHGCFMNGHSIR